MKKFLFLLFVAIGMHVQSQVSINNDSSLPDNSAIFDVKSTNKGMLLPRMTMAQRNAIASPATGLIVYQTDDTPGVYYNSGTSGSPTWVMAGGVTGWDLNGNSGTNPATNFIGTTDNAALNFRVNNQKAGRISSDGSLFLGYQAGPITTGAYNTGLGFQALNSNTTGSYNTAIGKSALYSNTTGSENAVSGNSALHSNETGWGNTANGFSALPDNTTSNWNTALGHTAGTGNTNGQFNTFIGTNTSGSSGLTNATAIGYNTQVTQSNSLVLGNNANVGIGISAPVAKLDIAGGNNWDLVNGEGDFRVGNSQYRLKMGVALEGGGAGDAGIMQYGQPNGYNVLSLGSLGYKLLFINGSTQKVGIGTDAPAANLDVHGTFSVVDGTQGAGKVLTSDAGGMASWMVGSTHAIGESYGGGIVFYVYDGGYHGLIAATANQGNGMRWYAGTNTNTMAMAGGFASDHCCSSGEANSSDVWIQAFASGGQSLDAKWKEYSVRAIRAF